MMPEGLPAAERPQIADAAPGAAPDPTLDDAPAVPAGEIPVAEHPLDNPRALQILSTEHWSLLTARSLAYNEAFARAGMFLSFLSATLIVIGLMVASDAFGEAVLPVAALLLAVDLFVGLATVGRLASASDEEFRALRGMNRIRHGYAEMVPGIERYFVASIHDDPRGVLSNFGDPGEDSLWLGFFHGLTTAIGMIAIIVCVIFAALIAVIAAGFGAPVGLSIGLGVAGFIVLFVISAMVGTRMATDVVGAHDVLFPAPREDPPKA